MSQGTLKVSSNQAMLNSLSDASTETFWESSGESRGNFKRIDLTFEEDVVPSAVAVHIDNTKDTGVCCGCGWASGWVRACTCVPVSVDMSQFEYIVVSVMVSSSASVLASDAATSGHSSAIFR